MYEEMFYRYEVAVDKENLGRHTFSIQLLGLLGGYDCKVGCWELNGWSRTPYGVKGKQYKNEKTMQKAVEKMLKNNGWINPTWHER